MLFNLPRELRDHIYDNVLDGVRVTFSDRQIRSGRGLQVSLFYRWSVNDATRPKLPPGLLASKQMLGEAVDQLYRYATCSITGTCGCIQCDVVGGRCEYYPGNLLSISRVQSFDGPVQDYLADRQSVFKLCQGKWTQFVISPETLLSSIDGEGTECEFAADGFFKYLLESPDHPAKQIKFSFDFPRMNSGKCFVPGPVDLSVFWSLGPRFDRVVMRLLCPYMPNERAPWPKLHVHAAMFTRLQLELARTAVLLVGGSDSSGYSVQDYMENGKSRGSLEWHVEAKRLPSEQSICIKYEGLRCFTRVMWTRVKSGPDYFTVLGIEKPGEGSRGQIAWYCKRTGEAQSAPLPLDNFENWHTKEVDGLGKVSKDLQAAFYPGTQDFNA